MKKKEEKDDSIRKNNILVKICTLSFVTCIISSLPSLSYAQTYYANQRFLDNAVQFDDEEGLRTKVEAPGLNNDDAQKQEIEVDTNGKQTRIEIKKTESKGKRGFSFSEMAKSTQIKTKSTEVKTKKKGFSFGEMASTVKSSNSSGKLNLSNIIEIVTTKNISNKETTTIKNNSISPKKNKMTIK